MAVNRSAQLITGLSSDSKPTDVPTGIPFYETDTNILYRFNGAAWNKETANLGVFSDTLQGVVPASGGGATNFLRADGSWQPSGGVGSGIVRSATVVADNTTGGTSAGTDYVYVASAGIKFTLPTAIGNTNLYTLKNLSNSSVLVAVTAGQDIDGSATALINNNESLSFISNNSVWGVI